MPSFTWLDYSEHDRRKTAEIIRLFAEQGTVDELGIGTVRDAFADLLFPGTSTLHTRARYLFFIPWIYRNLEGRRWDSAAAVAARARRDEVTLINALAESDDPHGGVIGIAARETLKRLPSEAYWQGLRVFGLRTFDDGLAAFHRRLAGAAGRRLAHELRSDDGDLVAGAATSLWHAGMPDPPDDFPGSASFALTREEARFLQDRARERIGGSLLAWLLRDGEGGEEVEMPWEHPELGEMREDHRTQLAHARRFSHAMRGAPLLYNLMLAELIGNDDLVEDYGVAIHDWAREIREQAHDFRTWDRAAMWQIVFGQNPQVPHRTREFVRFWLDLACDPDAAGAAADRDDVRAKIEHRERALKGARARLTNPKARAQWGGESGTAPLMYRWPNARRLVADVLAAD